MNFDPLRAELTSLRKGPGVTPSKLAECPVLLSHPRLAAHGDTAARVAAALDLLGQLLKELPDRRGNALRNAWSLTGSSTRGETLTDRRAEFGSLRGFSPETVKVWENQAISDVVLLLQRPVVPALMPALPSPDVLARQGAELQVDAADVRLRVRPDTGIEEVDQRLTIRALVDGVLEFRRGVWSTARPLVAADVLQVTGAKLAEIVELSNDGRQLVFEFPRPLEAGRLHSFSWRRRLAAPDATPYWTYSPQFRSVDLQVSVIFEEAEPALVWTIDNLFVRESPGVPTGKNCVAPSGSHFYMQTVTALPGKESGIAWEW